MLFRSYVLVEISLYYSVSFTPHFISLTFHSAVISFLGGIGSGVAVLGTLLYSLAKRQYAKKGASAH